MNTFKQTSAKMSLLAVGLIACIVLNGCMQPHSLLPLPLTVPPSPPLPPQPAQSASEDLLLIEPPKQSLSPEVLRTPESPLVDTDALDGLKGQLLIRGREAFAQNCTQCHEAKRALTAKKSLDEWTETIDEMVEYADADDVDMDEGQLVAIATYLAQRTDDEIAAAKVAAEKRDPDDNGVLDDKDESKQDHSEEIRKGQIAFLYSCLTCHDADRSLPVQKSFDGWLVTIRRMAKKADANIATDDFDPIARYLSSRSDEEIAVAKTRAADKESKEEDNESKESSASSELADGKDAFYGSCIKCHDAERSLAVEKSFDEWMSTIRRMSQKEDADIDSDDFRSIATFLSDRTSDEINEAKASVKSERDADAQDEDSETEAEADTGRKFDPALVSSGRTAFYKSCVKCHDAQRSLGKKKGLASWRATVRRMAAKAGADVAPGDVEAISVFLASESAGGDGAVDEGGGEEVKSWTFSSTLSTLHRTSSDPIENPGFFVDAWVGADWQSEGPLRATVMACTSCHSDRNSSGGFTLELVEASATLDLRKLLFEKYHSKATKRSARHMSGSGNAHGGQLALNAPENASQVAPTHAISSERSPVSTSLDLKMGRFVVPFGAYSAVSHPGSYRTLTNPLMFNMGRRLDTGGPFQPVLPAPYSDEGANLRFGLREYRDRSYTLDLFAINGLQGTSSGANFNSSRSYTDNNRTPAVGGRYTLGNHVFRLGASGMLGQMQNEGSSELDYYLIGADALINAEFWRAYFEYARRREEAGPVNKNEIDGYIVELELKLLERLGFLTRYDTLDHEIAAIGEQSIDRFTWGFNFSFERAGLLLINHEHWMLDDRSDVDVIGARWVTTF